MQTFNQAIEAVESYSPAEERFNRRKHGKPNVPFSAWELPELSARWCLQQAGLRPDDLDAVAYSFDPSLCLPGDELPLDDPWDHLRVEYARRAPAFLASALPGLDPDKVRFVAHHVAHAASAGLAGPYRTSASLVLDGRGERASHLALGIGALEVHGVHEELHRLIRRHLPEVEVHREDDPRAAVHAPEQRADAILGRLLEAVVPEEHLPVE